MKATWAIEYETENEFETSTAEAHINGPKLLRVVSEFQSWLFKQTEDDHEALAFFNHFNSMLHEEGLEAIAPIRD